MASDDPTATSPGSDAPGTDSSLVTRHLSSELVYLSVDEARGLLDRREVSSVELTEAHLRRIEEVEGRVKAFIAHTPDEALEQARLADDRIKAGEAAAFTGIPVALKDGLCTIDAPTTAGSPVLREFLPPYHATAVAPPGAEGAGFGSHGDTRALALGPP